MPSADGIGSAPATPSAAAQLAALNLHPSWAPIVAGELAKPYWPQLQRYVQTARGKAKVYPPADAVLAALQLTPMDDVRVVILGQDPYHGAGQAHGLSFSVERGVPLPPSLRNILKEVEADVGCLGSSKPPHGDLRHWARQGVLLLNTVLTVEAGKAGSHQKAGWETFTAAVLRGLAARKSGVVYLLWGLPAQKNAELLDGAANCVLTAPHPSPLSAHKGWFGSKHFSKTNAYLVGRGGTPIDWRLDGEQAAAAAT